MLSETDIHWIVGFLYLVSRREDITVVLGEKVYDEASETDRDVDIMIASVANISMVGVEVKDRGRPLDVGIVEGICQKFADMPTITSRSIVSSSGYTAPARRKAERHGVACLRIVRGAIPPFPTIDLSKVQEMRTSYVDWIAGPHVQLLASTNLSEFDCAQILPDTVLSYQSESEAPRVNTLQGLADRVVSGVTSSWEGPSNVGETTVTLDVEIEDAPIVQIGEHLIEFSKAQVTGVVRVMEEAIPLNQSCYLEDAAGVPFAAVALVELRTGLLGLSVSSSGQELRTFHIPESVRKVRPIRKRLN